MTNLNPDQQQGKRERLVEGACRMLHRQGVHATTLADIADTANVPVGNIFYYFKTKDELIEAAIDAHARDIQVMLAEFEHHGGPRARLKAFVHSWIDRADLVAQYGCRHGSLCQELDKHNDDLGLRAAKLLSLPIDWAEEQFRLMGQNDAHDLALALIAAFQGASLLTNTFRNPDILIQQSQKVEHWIDSLDSLN